MKAPGYLYYWIKIFPNSYRSGITGRKYPKNPSWSLTPEELYKLELIEDYQLKSDNHAMECTLNDYAKKPDRRIATQIRVRLINKIHKDLIAKLLIDPTGGIVVEII